MNLKKQGQTGEQIAAVLRQRILDWKYPPNHALGEGLLSEEFGASRSPVREALRSLEAEGLVLRAPNRGYSVRQVNPEEVAELYGVRLALELYAVEILTLHPDLYGAVQQLEEGWNALLKGKKIDSPVELARVDENFHTALTLATGNSMLYEYLARVNSRLFVFRTMDFCTVLEENSLEDSCRAHLRISQAILSGDVAAAQDALRANLDLSRGNVHIAMGKILTSAFYS